MRIVYWGTYDLSKPRNRIIIKGLENNGLEVTQIHENIWEDVRDKSQIKSIKTKVAILWKWFSSYPRLIQRYLRAPRHSVIIVGYLGHLDVLVIWILAKLRGVPIVWDAFISLYDSIVCDRKLVSKYNPIALSIYFFEWLVCKAADYVVLDTDAHAQFFRQKYNLSIDKCFSCFVGVEQENFKRTNPSVNRKGQDLSVLFYGQCIPLHGISVILDAILQLSNMPHIHWTIIGSGQEEGKIERFLLNHPNLKVTWLKWVEYAELNACIEQSDICLGIFGTSEKASRVIPNKVFQIVSCGKTLVTMDSPAIKELFPGRVGGLHLVKPGSSKHLADKIMELYQDRASIEQAPHFLDLQDKISPEGIAKTMIHKLNSIVNSAK